MLLFFFAEKIIKWMRDINGLYFEKKRNQHYWQLDGWGI